MRKKEKLSPPAVGACSLLVIFAVLCLTVLALLSVATVQADERLANASREAVLDYYQADWEAEQILARLRAGEWPEGVGREGDVYSYSCAISENRCLAVQVTVQGQRYEILQWQEVSTEEWQASEDLPVWSGKNDWRTENG